MTLKLNSSSSGSVSFVAPADTTAGADINLQLPVDGGTVDRLERAGNILQVKQTVKTNIFSTTADGFNDVTGLTVDITPTSSSSKILAICFVNYGTNSDDIRLAARIVREEGGSDSVISQADADGSRIRSMWLGRHPNSVGITEHVNIQILDSPSTTNALTYKFQTGRIDGGTLIVNYGRNDSDSSSHARGISTITVMEVAA
jgi:hypothetical protein